MDQTLPEIQNLNRNILINELTQGRELVKELKIILDKPFGNDRYSEANDLIAKISSSFIGSISMMNQVSKVKSLASPLEGSPDFYEHKEDSENSSKPSLFKNRRGRYKRRKMLHTSTQIVANLIDDGHAWRKYGQKVIQNANQPRNYYRCTHKFDQGCPATKQVQKTETEPQMYQIIYNGRHTCKTVQSPQLEFDTTDLIDSKYLISFDSSNKSHDIPTLPSFIKQECNPKIEHHQSPSFDHYVSPDFMPVCSSGPLSVLLSGSDQCDASSYFTATSAPNNWVDHMDMMENLDPLDGFWANLGSNFKHLYT